MKTADELNALKADVEAMREKLAVLTEEELKQVTGGLADNTFCIDRAMCSSCGLCLECCPTGAIDNSDGYSIIADFCVGCEACLDVCPTCAIRMS